MADEFGSEVKGSDKPKKVEKVQEQSKCICSGSRHPSCPTHK